MKTQPERTEHSARKLGLTLVKRARVRWDRLNELLRNAGVVDDSVIAKAGSLQRDNGLKPVEAFLELRAIKETDLVKLLCRELDLPRADLGDATIDLTVKLGAPELPVYHLAIPWLLEGDVLHVAMADPTDFGPVYEMLFRKGLRVRLYCAAVSAIKAVFTPPKLGRDYEHNGLFRRARGGDADAQFQMGELYYPGDVLDEEEPRLAYYEAALKWWLLAAASGHTQAAYHLAWMYYNGIGVQENKETAAPWFRRAAEHGDSVAQFYLAWLHHEGPIVLRDYEEAAKWHRLAAEGGQTPAQNNLGFLYDYGLGVPQDEFEAAKLYRNAADNGSQNGQWNLALCYEYGTGVAQDMDEALRWFQTCANQGHVSAMNALGDRFQNGWGCCMKNPAEAVSWFWKGARQGDAYSLFKLGEAFDRGLGTWPDRAIAMKFYFAAARKGPDDARQALRRLLRRAQPSDARRSTDYGDWDLEHYPVVLQRRSLADETGNAAARDRGRWTARIMGGPSMIGSGECEEDAYADLQARFLRYKERGGVPPAPVTDHLE